MQLVVLLVVWLTLVCVRVGVQLVVELAEELAVEMVEEEPVHLSCEGVSVCSVAFREASLWRKVKPGSSLLMRHLSKKLAGCAM